MTTPKIVVLNTRLCIKSFEGMCTAMTEVDYDLSEILTYVVELLSRRQHLEQRTEALVAKYQTYGSLHVTEAQTGDAVLDPLPTADGAVLGAAIAFLVGAVGSAIEHVGLYSENGDHDYLFREMIAQDIVLERRTTPN